MVGARRNEAKRGFTLIELMIAVAMIGIMAALALYGYRRWLNSARSAEAREMLNAIGTAQKMYFDETRGYLNCSSSWTDFYPGTPMDGKRHFDNPTHGKYKCWKLLAVRADSPVVMGYTVRAGTASQSPPTTNIPGVTWPKVTGPWWVAQASGDSNADGVMSYYMTSSLNAGEIFSENESE